MNYIIKALLFVVSGILLSFCWLMVWATMKQTDGGWGFLGFGYLVLMTGIFISLLK